MSVKKHDRHESKVEFENAYFTIHDDAIQLIQNSFGGTKEKRIIFKDYLAVSSRKILADILDIGTEITESEISNCYRSWKYSTIKDCSHCKRTIQSMDSLYNALFPESDKNKKPKRQDLIRKENI